MKANPTLDDIIILASLLPSGANDPQAANKLIAEKAELEAAVAANDWTGLLTEAADAAYYAAKYMHWVCRQVSDDCTIDDLLRLAAAKYELRARPGNPKDDWQERRACVKIWAEKRQ